MRTYGLHLTRAWRGMSIQKIFDWRICLFLLFLVFSTAQLRAQVVINEILPDGTVELKNLGNTNVDVSSYWLCNFPDYIQIQNANVACGNMNLGSGEILAIDDFFDVIFNDDGEMGLYTTNSFGSSSAIIDYVEWGSTGHQRSNVAVAAGIWTTGDFVPAFATGESLEYSGTGDSSTDWATTATPTICNENGGGAPQVDEVVINEILPNGTVEIKNIGTTTVDVSTYWLCDFPTYAQIQNSNIICGNTMLAPGEILAVDDFNTINNNDGEMGLYTTNAFGSSSAIVDYVEWGFTGHQRSSVAVAAGIWTTGDFVPAFATGESIEYSGMGDSSTDWNAAAAPSICMENGTGTPPQVDEVVINEVLPNGTVEIKNIGTTTVDVSTYWLCDFPTYAQIQNSNIICGNTMLAPGEILAVDDFNTINNNDGEMGLYTTNAFGSSDAIVDYVEWGFTGHTRSSVAVAAGIWTTGDFVPAFATGESIEYSGMGDSSTDWAATATPSICMENGGGNACMVDGGDITFSDGSTSTSICVDGNPDPLNVVFSNNSSGTSTGWIITDDSNNILALPQSPPFDLDGAGLGTCIIWHIAYEPNSGFGGNAVGNNLTDLTGCFDLSDGLTVYREAADGGTVSLSDGTNSTSICVDGNADPLGVVHTTNAPNLTYDYVITDDNDVILAFATDGPIDLDGAGIGTCRIWGWSYRGIDETAFVGLPLADLQAEDCSDISSNFIEVIREEADGGTVSLADGTNATSICVDGNADPLGVVHTTNAPNLTYDYVITDDNDIILAFAADGPIDLDGAGIGTCRIWGWSYRGIDETAFVGLPLADLQAQDCSDISSNFIEVIREEADGGMVSLADGTNSTSICVDGNADPLGVVHTTTAPNLTYDYVITDDNDVILAFATDGPIDLDGAGVGTCRIWGWSYRGIDETAFVGLPLADLQAQDCSDISSNFIEVIREAADGGTVSLADGTNSVTIIVDGVPDPLDVVHTTTAPNLTYDYVITNDNDVILAFVADGPIDLDGAGVGTCRIWGWSYRGIDETAFVGLPLADLQAQDCSDISTNFIEVIREAPVGCNVFVNDISLSDGTTSTSICVDGNPDPLNVVTNGGTPNVSTGWIITDDLGNILALPQGPPFDLDGAGVGTCEIWYIRYEMGSGFGGNTVGNNLTDLTGCFALSNPITVIREAADGGTVSLSDGTNSTSICVDGNADPLGVVHTTDAPNLTYDYVITDDNDVILAFATDGPIDLDGAGVGTCRIWGWSYRGIDQTTFVGLPLADLQAQDCSDISSNFIEVIREAADGGTVSLADGTNSTSICVDGNADPLGVVHTTNAPNLTYDYVITDDNDVILAFAADGPIDLDGAGVGTCRIWGWSYRGIDQTTFVGLPLTDLQAQDCSDISTNFIEVIREAADGGTVSLADGTNSTSICVDGNADPLGVVHTTNAPNLTYDYVITDDNDVILAFAADGPIDLDGAGVGTCRIWGWSYRGIDQTTFVGLPLADLQAEDCSDISSNFIEVIREAADGGTVSLADGTNSTSICVDGNADPLGVVHTTTAPNLTYDYVITDDNNNILAFAADGPIDLDGAGVGTCRIWGWSYRGIDQTTFVGLPLADLQAQDCSDISSNFIEVIREAADGGTVSLADGTNSVTIIVDGVPDPLTVVHTTTAPNLTYDYVITDDNNNILAFAADGPIDLDGAGVGTCRIWGWSYRGIDQTTFVGLPLADLQAQDCSDISSNFITVIRQDAGCTVFVNDITFADGSTSTSICVDGNADPLNVVTNGGTPNVSTGWIITDDLGNILGLPQAPPFDLDGAGIGTCQIWYVRYETGTGFGGNTVGNNLSDITGCFALSNPLTVIREEADGGFVVLSNGQLSTSICVDGNPDFLSVFHSTESPNLTSRFVITDEANTILAFSNTNQIELDGAGVGICRIWGWNYRGLNQNDFIGLPLADLQAQDCSDISENFIEVIREAPDGGMVSLLDGSTTYTGTAGDIVVQVQHTTNSPNLSYWYIVTDDNDNILDYLNSANGNTLDLSGAPVGECHIWGWNYRGLPNPVLGDHISTLTDDACEDISDNFITVIRQDGAVVQTFKAELSGTQEVPTATTPAKGSVQATLNGNVLTVTGSFDGLLGEFDANIAGGAHIHNGIAGRNGGIEFLLTTNISSDLRSGTFEASANTFTLTDEQLTALNARSLYFNIHTTRFPGGELRGQLLPQAEECLHTVLLGSNEVPSIQTDAFGSLVFELNGNALTVSGSFDDLSGDIAVDLAGGAHIHDGVAGRNGGVEFPLNLTLDADNQGAIIEAYNNVFTLTDDQVTKLLSEGYYINVHSLTNMPGELRGQIAPIASSTFRAQLAGSQEIPVPVKTNADGRILLSYNGMGQITVSGSFNNLSSDLNTDLAGGVHIHFGKAGENGGIAFILNPTTNADNRNAVFYPVDNTFDITPQDLHTLFARGFYVNVHSFDNVPGELRGQILPIAKGYLATSLSGLNEVPSVLTPAFGAIQFEINDNQLIATGSFSDLTGDFATNLAGGSHLHLSDASGNGPIGVLLNANANPDLRGASYYSTDNVFTISDGLKDSLLNGYLYVNIHSQAVLSGELRGQVLRDDNAFPSNNFSITSPANNAIISIDGNASTPFTVNWESTTDSNNDLVVYTWQLASDADFTQVLFMEKVGTALSFSTTNDLVDSLLASAGLTTGESINLYHRVIASDGSLSCGNAPYTVTLTRGDGNTNVCNAPDFLDGFTSLGQFGDSKYYLSNGISRPTDAQALAETFGGYLAAIGSQEENDFIQQNIPELTYIGLNDYNVEGQLEWFNGEPLTFNNVNPCPVGCEVNADNQDFVIIAPWDGAWSFSNFFAQRRFVVEIPCGTTATPFLSVTCPDDVTYTVATGESVTATWNEPIISSNCPNSDFELVQIGGITQGTAVGAGTYTITYEASDACDNIETCSFNITVIEDNGGAGCPINDIAGFVTLGQYGNSTYYLSNDVSRPLDAQILAESYGGYLATISSQSENDFIQERIPELVYIGLNDFDSEGNLEWFNGEDLTFNNVAPCDICEENADNQDFVVIAPWDGLWSFSNFFAQRRFVLEVPCTPDNTLHENAESRTQEALESEELEVSMEKLMPNPATDFITAVVLSKVEKNTDLRVFDSRGSVVLVKNVSLNEGANSIELNITELPTGFYYIHVPQKGGMKKGLKFIKVNK